MPPRTWLTSAVTLVCFLHLGCVTTSPPDAPQAEAAEPEPHLSDDAQADLKAALKSRLLLPIEVVVWLAMLAHAPALQ